MRAVPITEDAKQALWAKEGEQKRLAVQRMFADIAPSYDTLNGLISFRLHHRWRLIAVRKLGLQPGDSALDVCCGTGDFMLPLKKAVGSAGKVFGIDFCEPMLEIAQRKLPESRLGLGDACRLPVQDACFNAVSVGWGIRNVPDIDAAHRELVRVLKRGGRFVSLDMARPKSALLKRVSEWTFNTMVPKLGALFGKKEAYTYLPKSTQRFWSREELKDSMQRAGLVDVACQDLFFGNICVHWGTKA